MKSRNVCGDKNKPEIISEICNTVFIAYNFVSTESYSQDKNRQPKTIRLANIVEFERCKHGWAYRDLVKCSNLWWSCLNGERLKKISPILCGFQFNSCVDGSISTAIIRNIATEFPLIRSTLKIQMWFAFVRIDCDRSNQSKRIHMPNIRNWIECVANRLHQRFDQKNQFNVDDCAFVRVGITYIKQRCALSRGHWPI